MHLRNGFNNICNIEIGIRKMKVLMINSVCGIRSTGRICTDLAKVLEEQGHTVKIAYGREIVPKEFEKYAVRIGTNLDVYFHVLQSRLFDNSGFCSTSATKKFIKWVREYNPDVIHLHNLHGYYINIEVLFKYLKEEFKGKIIWTLHDCWAFTGHCAYFDYVNCSKWKNECCNCPAIKDYPKSHVDNVKRNFKKKEELFTGLNNLIIVTPSKWLSDEVNKSFLKNYPVQVIHNGIDTNVFKPTKSNIKEKYNIKNKKIVLGVSSVWDRRKGLEYMVDLSRTLDETYIVVVIGITKKQQKNLPPNMLGILHTNSIKELVEWYSAAEVFVNPTLEDNYPTTNLEAISCGTPVITFDTGGSPESAIVYGTMVEKGDVKAVCNLIMQNGFVNKNYTFPIETMIERYIEIYCNY